MEDATGGMGEGDAPEPRMTLIAINQSYWLVEGEEYLDAMLMGNGFFPKPVRCMVFANAFEMRVFVGSDVAMTDYWGINPDIVERLRRDGHLIDVRAQDSGD